MKINYITCSDPRDHNSLDDLFGLWQLDDRVEIAVQMHPGKVSPGTDRYEWVRALVDRLKDDLYPYNFAMHINSAWCYDVCNGKIPDALKEFFDAAYRIDKTPMPAVRRIQLNMPEGAANSLKPYVLADVIKSFPNQEFIIQYNDVTKAAVERLHETGAQFSLLFDSSGGRGISPKSWSAPVYPEHPMGYSGGFSPETVVEKLDKISAVVPAGDKIWIDAEKGLTVPDENGKNLFNIERAREYITNTLNWMRQNRR